MQVTIYDTTLRDGTQGTGISFSTLDKIRVAARAGALLAQAPAPVLDALTLYGENVGLAFQIADDSDNPLMR